MKKKSIFKTIAIAGLLFSTIYSCKKEKAVACFSVDKATATIGDTLIFDISCSENVSNTKWNFGDGTEVEQDRKLSIKHSFNAIGQYTVKLRACPHAMAFKSVQCEETSQTITIIP